MARSGDSKYLINQFQKEIVVENFTISDNSKTFIIAELSANHNNDYDIAVKSIVEAAKSGANAIKTQTFLPETMTIDCDNKYFQVDNNSIWAGKTLFELYEDAYMPMEWHYKLKKIAENEGLIYLSTPFDIQTVDFLEELNIAAYKVASCEITDSPLIKHIASKGKAMLISTGISLIEDIENVLDICLDENNNQVVLLKCSTEYPADLDKLGLKSIQFLNDYFHTIVGLSDHSLGSFASIISGALGAKVIEKHFVLDRNITSPDASFSMEPKEFSAMVQSIRETEKALGDYAYNISEKSLQNRQYARSLFVIKEIKKDEAFTNENVKSIRPNYGLHPKYLYEIIGKKATENIVKGTPLNWNFIK